MAFFSAQEENTRRKRDSDSFSITFWIEGEAASSQGQLEFTYSDVHLMTYASNNHNNTILTVQLPQCTVVSDVPAQKLPSFKLSLGQAHRSRFISVNSNSAADCVDKTRTLATELSKAILSAPIIRTFRSLISDLKLAVSNAALLRHDPTDAAAAPVELEARITADRALDEASNALCTFSVQRMATVNAESTALRDDTVNGGVLFDVLIAAMKVTDAPDATVRRVLRIFHAFLTGRTRAKVALLQMWPEAARSLVAAMIDPRSSTSSEALRVLYTLSSLREDEALVRGRNDFRRASFSFGNDYSSQPTTPTPFPSAFVAADGAPSLHRMMRTAAESNSIECLTSAAGTMLNFSLVSDDVLASFAGWLGGPLTIARALNVPAATPKLVRLLLELAILVSSEPLSSVDAHDLATVLRRLAATTTELKPVRIRALHALALLRDTHLDLAITASAETPTDLLAVLNAAVDGIPWDGRVPSAMSILDAFNAIAALPSTGNGCIAIMEAGLTKCLVRALLSRIRRATLPNTSSDILSFSWWLRRYSTTNNSSFEIEKPVAAVAEANAAISALLWLTLRHAGVIKFLLDRGVAKELEKLTSLNPNWRNARALAWMLDSLSAPVDKNIRVNDIDVEGMKKSDTHFASIENSSPCIVVLAANTDADVASTVALSLRNAGFLVWLDDGENERPTLRSAVASAFAVVALHSKEAAVSAALVTECKLACASPQHPSLFILTLEGDDDKGYGGITNTVPFTTFNCSSSQCSIGIAKATKHIAKTFSQAAIQSIDKKDAFNTFIALDADSLARGLEAAGVHVSLVKTLRERGFCGLQATPLVNLDHTPEAVTLVWTLVREITATTTTTLLDSLSLYTALKYRMTTILKESLVKQTQL
jgi:hypothetical protein